MYEYIRKWVIGVDHSKPQSSVSVKDGDLYSYATRIARRGSDGRSILLNRKKYSVTTSKQQGFIRRAADSEGMTVHEYDNE